MKRENGLFPCKWNEVCKQKDNVGLCYSNPGRDGSRLTHSGSDGSQEKDLGSEIVLNIEATDLLMIRCRVQKIKEEAMETPGSLI